MDSQYSVVAREPTASLIIDSLDGKRHQILAHTRISKVGSHVLKKMVWFIRPRTSNVDVAKDQFLDVCSCGNDADFVGGRVIRPQQLES
jgi:hypothetical protein